MTGSYFYVLICYFFMKYLLKSFLTATIGLLFSCWVLRVLYILWTPVPHQITCKYFLLAHRLPFQMYRHHVISIKIPAKYFTLIFFIVFKIHCPFCAWSLHLDLYWLPFKCSIVHTGSGSSVSKGFKESTRQMIRCWNLKLNVSLLFILHWSIFLLSFSIDIKIYLMVHEVYVVKCMACKSLQRNTTR